MMIAATVLQTVAAAVKPWSSLYSDSTAVSSAVTFVHLGGLLFAGGLAVGVIQALSSLFFPIQLQNLVLFIVFILVLAVRPQGLVGASR